MESVFGRGTFWSQKNEAEFYLPEFKGLIDDPQTHSCLVEERRCRLGWVVSTREEKVLRSYAKVEKLKHEGLGKAFFVIKQQDVLETKLKLEVTWTLQKKSD